MLGTDIVENRRIEKIYSKYGKKFLNKIFTNREIENIEKKGNKIENIAGLYAAKEALSKAMGTGIGKYSFKELEICHHKKGAPYGKVKGEKIFLSISHERDYSVATAIRKYESEITIPKEFQNILPQRKKNSHKGDYGKIAIYAGQRGMMGAAYLSCMAALKSGAGLVYNIVPEELLDIATIKHLETISKSFSKEEEELEFLETINVIGAGPAMGLGSREEKTLERLLKLSKPLVLDADALTILSKKPTLLEKIKGKNIVLTPHSGEFARLINKSVKDIELNRIELAQKFAKEYGVTLVLKGHESIVAYGEDAYINNSGNAGMATAGSGDVLTGIICALLARGLNCYSAAKLSVYIHGLAGDLAAEKVGEDSLVASNILENMCKIYVNLPKM